MPIRINLLAEAQAQEELRRKDPVKRAVAGSFALVVAFLLWSVILQLKIVASSAELKGLDVQWKSIEPSFKTAEESQRGLMEVEKRLLALEVFRTNRFLWGSALNAFQHTLDKMDAIQVVRLRTEQTYRVESSSGSRTNGTTVTPPTPGKATEKISIFVEATDSSPTPGGQVNRYKQSILAVPYFKGNLLQTNSVLLTSQSPPAVDPESGASFVKFSLQCLFPEKVR
jgi:hypothetical protein